MKIKTAYISVNPYNRPGRASTPKRICIHYTGDRGTDAERLLEYYNNVAKGVFKTSPLSWTSCQYIVPFGTSTIIHVIPDNEISYAASNENADTIHIEVCYKNSNGAFEASSIKLLTELVIYLMDKYNISADNVVRHYDLTGKACPFYYVDAKRWQELHDTITGYAKHPTIYRVQVGAYASKSNADALLKSLKKAGFDGFITKTSS